MGPVMERMDKIVVIILKGSENWPVWKFRTKDELSKWIKRDQLAQDLIVAKMDEGPINHILTFDTAHDMWQKSLTVYDKKSEDIRNQLKQLGEDMSDRMLSPKV
ncbi:hypothetical protein ILUMI_14087 [Ignelater luminosus]|uniref:Uncharacterized protein n=1 Tax=Ignelater luminosus TaxID=2038154 RepID=A0A8K0CUX5_IGNLU|nr:hypothetical protein ILUMI_14087 [Ignelater luminosus]